MTLALRSAVAAVPGPTSLRLPDLLHITDLAAAEVLDGHYDHLLPPDGPPRQGRWYTRLRSDDELDIWLISWTPGETTELHDHGGSLGALTVLTGALQEFRWAGDGLRHRRLAAGDQAAFPLGWVHDVTWAQSGASGPSVLSGHVGSSAPLVAASALEAPAPTLSVHAYSPPLTAMSYYQVTERNTLRRVRSELTDGQAPS